MPAQLPSDPRARLAVLEHERRQAIYEAREAHGDTPTMPPPARVPTLDGIGPARDKLPTLDDLTGPDAPKARWKLVLAVAAGLASLGECARQIVELVKH